MGGAVVEDPPGVRWRKHGESIRRTSRVNETWNDCGGNDVEKEGVRGGGTSDRRPPCPGPMKSFSTDFHMIGRRSDHMGDFLLGDSAGGGD